MGTTQKMTENFYIPRVFDDWPSGRRGKINICFWGRKLCDSGVFSQRGSFLLASVDRKALSCSVRGAVGTASLPLAAGDTGQSPEGTALSRFPGYAVTACSGHGDGGRVPNQL